MTRFLPSAALLLVAVAASGLVLAQGLHDPTQPPPGYQPVVPAEKVAPVEPATPPVPPVQIKRLDPVPAPAAGRRPAASDPAGPTRVVSVTAEGVLVQTGASKQSMPAASAVVKKMVSEK